MKPFTYLFTLAFGVAMGALVMLMAVHDDTQKSIDTFTKQINSNIKCFPTVRMK